MHYVESAEKVRRVILAAIEEAGMEGFLKEVNVAREEVEKWLLGEGWVPLRVVTAACTLGRGRLGALAKVSEVLDGLDVIDELTYEMLSMRGTQKVQPTPASIVSATTQKERAAERKAEEAKRLERSHTFSWVIIRSTVLVIGMLISSFAGYIVGSHFGIIYAGLGMFVPILVGILLALLWSLRTEHASTRASSPS
jgi:hypothetical protein